MGLILFLLFSVFIFRFLGGFARITLFSILALLFVITIVAHLWWLIFLIIPFAMFSGRGRRRAYAKTDNNHSNTVDGDYEEVDDNQKDR